MSVCLCLFVCLSVKGYPARQMMGEISSGMRYLSGMGYVLKVIICLSVVCLSLDKQ